MILMLGNPMEFGVLAVLLVPLIMLAGFVYLVVWAVKQLSASIEKRSLAKREAAQAAASVAWARGACMNCRQFFQYQLQSGDPERVVCNACLSKPSEVA